MPDWTSRAASSEPTYRAYRISASGGIVTADVISAIDDASAATKAQLLATLYPIELWERARFLGRFEPNASSTAIAIRSAA